MPFTIIKAEDEINVKNLVVLIYGQPGVGKSSIAFTASRKRVLTLDFDKGSHRSAFRKDVLAMANWGEVQDLLKDADALKDYDAIVVDTVGRALDFIVATFPPGTKLVTRNGNPTMQGWGELKAIFQSFNRTLLSMGKDIILVAHEKEDKDGDATAFRPDVSGGSYGEVFKIADFIGRMFKVGNKTTLDFEPCEKYMGKNSAQIPAQTVPDFAVEPEFLQGLLATMKASLGKTNAAQKEAVGKLEQYRATINACSTTDELNNVLESATGEDASLKKQIKALADSQASKLSATFNKDSRRYVASEARAKTNGKPSAILNGASKAEPAKEEPAPAAPVQEEAPKSDEKPAAEGGDDEW